MTTPDTKPTVQQMVEWVDRMLKNYGDTDDKMLQGVRDYLTRTDNNSPGPRTLAADTSAIALAEASNRVPSGGEVTPQGGCWRPISTAPVNESILIYLPNGEHYGPGIYRAIQVNVGTGKRWHTTAWACGRDLGGEDWPRFWMPLPQPPEKT